MIQRCRMKHSFLTMRCASALTCLLHVLAVVLILSVYLLGPPVARAEHKLEEASFGLSGQEPTAPHAAAGLAQQQTPPVQRVPDARDRILFSNETESFKPLV